MAEETVNPSGEPPKIRLNLNAFGKPKTDVKDVPMPVKPAAPPAKSETTRIDLAKAVPAKIETQRMENADASKFTTMRVEIVDTPRKSETTRIDLAAAAPKPAARIDLAKEGDTSDDVFKRSTIAVGVPSNTRPRTIQVKKPAAKTGESLITPAVSTAESVSEAKKSETARIDLPPDGSADRPATRPKTIRIKRPDGTSGRKPLMIARPSDEGATAAITPAFSEPDLALEDDGPGTVFSILALVALLVACAVVYVLAATLSPDVAFPGRLV